METPGSILAKLIKGEDSVTQEDLKKSSEQYFKDKGVDVKINIGTSESDEQSTK